MHESKRGTQSAGVFFFLLHCDSVSMHTHVANDTGQHCVGGGDLGVEVTRVPILDSSQLSGKGHGCDTIWCVIECTLTPTSATGRPMCSAPFLGVRFFYTCIVEANVATLGMPCMANSAVTQLCMHSTLE